MNIYIYACIYICLTFHDKVDASFVAATVELRRKPGMRGVVKRHPQGDKEESSCSNLEKLIIPFSKKRANVDEPFGDSLTTDKDSNLHLLNKLLRWNTSHHHF